jgi:hypothetical protein
LSVRLFRAKKKKKKNLSVCRSRSWNPTDRTSNFRTSVSNLGFRQWTAVAEISKLGVETDLGFGPRFRDLDGQTIELIKRDMLRGMGGGGGWFFLQIHYEGGWEGGGGRRGLVFFVKPFFHYWMAREGGQGFFFFFDLLKEDSRGKGMIFFRVGLIHFILTKLN